MTVDPTDFNNDLNLLSAAPASDDTLLLYDKSADNFNQLTVRNLFQGISVNVGIGTSSPDSNFHVLGDARIQSDSGFGQMFITDPTGLAGGRVTGDGNNSISLRANTTGFNTVVAVNGDNDQIDFLTGGSLIARIDSSGGFRLGTTSADGLLTLGLATENAAVVNAGSTGATEQDWIEVKVGGATGYIRVYGSK